MHISDTQSLQEELERFRKEKEMIRNVVGQIGGAKSEKRDMVITIIFSTAIIILFALDIVRHYFNINIPLQPLFSLELGVLLVSIKIIWMIHKQSRVEHFQFWILNSIEFRLTDISKRLSTFEESNTKE
jgi:hypothetical protein